MTWNTASKLTKGVIYRIKRQNGRAITIRSYGTTVVNRETGAQTVAYVDYVIRRATILQFKQFRDFVYDLSFIAANKNFTYGGLFIENMSLILIDKDDLSITLHVDQDEVIVGSDSYVIKDITSAMNDEMVAFTIGHVKGFSP